MMENQAYVLNCKITDREAFISGIRHVVVVKPNGMSFYMDDFFLDVLRAMNDDGLVERLKSRYNVPEEYVIRAVEVVITGNFVLKQGGCCSSA